MNFDLYTVDTTTFDPWKGSFVVTDPGLWRFSFTAGIVYIPPGAQGSDSIPFETGPKYKYPFMYRVTMVV